MTLFYNQHCERNLNSYICDLNDQFPYFFMKCNKILITLVPSSKNLTTNDAIHNQYFLSEFDPNKQIKNLRFIYHLNDKVIEEPIKNPNFTLTEFSIGYYNFVCDINRPTALIIRKGSPMKIAIHFDCEVDFQSIQFSVESTHEDKLIWSVCNVF